VILKQVLVMHAAAGHMYKCNKSCTNVP